MENLTKKDYEKEIVRFCQILTQQKCDKNDDKMIKKLLEENLKHVSFDATLQDSNKISKKIQLNKILKLSTVLVNVKYGSQEDAEIKAELSLALALLSKSVENSRQARAETRAENEKRKMAACF